MIHVMRNSVPRPACLDGDESLGGKERLKAIEYYADPANKGQELPSMNFKAYKHDDVKKALNELFHSKCAYCESSYAATAPVDIEHYRPKAAVKITSKQTLRGYYWLAADWDNLLPSCIDCNRGRTQEFLEGEARVSGKANAFPLHRERKRARQPGDEVLEEPLLLNPCIDRPEEHLIFTKEGDVQARYITRRKKSPKGLASIEVYGLRRVPLLLTRRDHLKMIYAWAKRWVTDRLRNPEDLDTLNEDRQNLYMFCEPSRPYLAMTRQVIQYVDAVMDCINALDNLRKAEPLDLVQIRKEDKVLKTLLNLKQPFADLGLILKPQIMQWIELVF
jgi:uncharacterized protein (TIGR02646 family)